MQISTTLIQFATQPLYCALTGPLNIYKLFVYHQVYLIGPYGVGLDRNRLLQPLVASGNREEPMSNDVEFPSEPVLFPPLMDMLLVPRDVCANSVFRFRFEDVQYEGG